MKELGVLKSEDESKVLRVRNRGSDELDLMEVEDDWTQRLKDWRWMFRDGKIWDWDDGFWDELICEEWLLWDEPNR